MRTLIATAVAGLAAGAAVALSPPARRRYARWGATTEEATGPLPGDDLLATTLVTTRATTIAAPPSAIWPWLVQMGSGRGGAYTYDWIENLLGLDMHSADEILPQFQDLAVGDELPLGGNAPAMRVEICDPERALVFRSTDGAWVWIFALHPDATGTRLISRNRISPPGGSAPARWFYGLWALPGSLVMERRMLLGIRQRAEHLHATDPGRSSLTAPPVASGGQP